MTEALSWWRANRSAAPDALEQDLREALELVRTQPRIGAPARNIRFKDVRRLHLTRVRYDLYYRLTKDGATIEVVAFWHSSRGVGPQI